MRQRLGVLQECQEVPNLQRGSFQHPVEVPQHGQEGQLPQVPLGLLPQGGDAPQQHQEGMFRRAGRAERLHARLHPTAVRQRVDQRGEQLL